jgi:acyl-CoA hydrolase
MMLQPKSPRESEVVMTQMILPGDANALNSAFGGKVMEWMDICGAICAQRHCRHTVVTASMDDLHFHASIRVGWNVTLRARVLATFKTSMEVGVTVTGENPLTGQRYLTTSALMTFVALAEDGTRVRVPGLIIENDDDKMAFAEAQARHDERLSRRGQVQHWQKVLKAES